LFMFVEGVAVILMTVPITMPILTASEIDVLWFGVFVAVICTIGLLTPPVGLSVFAVSGSTQISVGSIFSLSNIFSVVSMIVMSILFILFLEIVTWLPSRMN